MRSALLVPFCISLVFALFEKALFPSLHLLAFAPFLTFSFPRATFIVSLWISLICGLLMDTLSSGHFFGFHALSYCLTAFFLYAQKRHFFDDKALGLSLFTALFALVLTLIEWVLGYTFEQLPKMRWQLAVTDLLCMPLCDAIYAFIWFTCPYRAYVHVRTLYRTGKWKNFLLLLRKKDTPNE